jgi:hypothetical protein
MPNMSRLIAFIVVAICVLGLGVVPARAQRIDPNSQELLAYRLTPDAIAKLRQVMVAMDTYKAPSPDAVRSDIAVVTVLGMNTPNHQPYSDAKVRETVTVVDRAHAELRETIKRAGLTSRDYVMAWMTLMVAHPAVVAQKSGRTVETGVAPENLAFVGREWTTVNALVTDVGQRIDKARPGR